jgi:hypothetical protein
MSNQENQLTPHKERPGWMAIALIAVFVLAGIAMYLVGVHLIKR